MVIQNISIIGNHHQHVDLWKCFAPYNGVTFHLTSVIHSQGIARTSQGRHKESFFKKTVDDVFLNIVCFLKMDPSKAKPYLIPINFQNGHLCGWK